MNAPLEVARATFVRTLRKTLRRPVQLTFSFVQPFMWMLFFGFLFARYQVDDLHERVGYRTFFLPAAACMSVLFGASQSGVELVRDHQTGVLARMIAVAADRRAMLLGKIAADVVRLVAQAMVLVAIGAGLGADVAIDVVGLGVATVAVALFAVMLASISCAIALLTRNPEGMALFVHLINMPLLFTSTALVPGRHLPPPLAVVARANPLSLAVDALRDAIVFERVPGAAALVPLACAAALAAVLAVRCLARQSRV